ncbi:hypothetical protein [Pseudonocardia sp.]|jgi:hypothetical protein|uniref:hypothetical protein n=1 Tax=Pseudonocardia sp. TaxID=60912 RepID=UPI0031FD3181
MTTTVLALAAVALLVFLAVRGHRTGRRPFHLDQFRPAASLGGVFAGPAPVDMDRERLVADLRALPDSPADVEYRLRV